MMGFLFQLTVLSAAPIKVSLSANPDWLKTERLENNLRPCGKCWLNNSKILLRTRSHLSNDGIRIFRHKQNWWMSLNKSGDQGALRKCSDFNQALSALNRIHRQSGGHQLRPMPCWKYKEWKPASSSSTWWQWRESRWSSLEFKDSR